MEVKAHFFGEENSALGTESRTLSTLKLSALDLVFGATLNGKAWRDEWMSVLTHLVYQQRSAVRQKALRAQIEWTPQLDQLLSAAVAVWQLLTATRPLRAEDVTWPPQPGEHDESETRTAVDNLEKALRETLASLTTLIGNVAWSSSQFDAMHQALFDAWSTGTGNVVAAPDADQAALRALGERAVEDINRRLDAAAAEQDIDVRFSLLAGNSLRYVPALGLTAASRKTLDAATFGNESGPLEARRWYRQAARVRKPAQALSDALLCADAMAADAPSRWDCLHLPRSGDQNERWVGVDASPPNLRSDAERPRARAEVSVVSLKASGLKWSKATRGLLVDSWAEQLPAAEQTTGITFHYDAPGAAPPQMMLIAVTPAPDQPWNADLLAATISEALALGKLRGVGYGDVPQLHHFLPTVVLPHNAAPDSLSAEP